MPACELDVRDVVEGIGELVRVVARPIEVDSGVKRFEWVESRVGRGLLRLLVSELLFGVAEPLEVVGVYTWTQGDGACRVEQLAVGLYCLARPPQIAEEQSDAQARGEEECRGAQAHVEPLGVTGSSEREAEVAAPPCNAPFVVRHLGAPLGVVARELRGVGYGRSRLAEAVALDEEEGEREEIVGGPRIAPRLSRSAVAWW